MRKLTKDEVDKWIEEQLNAPEQQPVGLQDVLRKARLGRANPQIANRPQMPEQIQQ